MLNLQVSLGNEIYQKVFCPIVQIQRFMSLIKKGAILSFVQSGNFETSSVTGFEPGTFRITVGSLIHYTKFPYGKKFKNFKPNLETYEPQKKGAILSFVQPGNFELLSQTGFEPGTLRVAVGPLIHYTKFHYDNFYKNFKTNVKRFLQSFCGRVASRLEQQTAISFEKS